MDYPNATKLTKLSSNFNMIFLTKQVACKVPIIYDAPPNLSKLLELNSFPPNIDGFSSWWWFVPFGKYESSWIISAR